MNNMSNKVLILLEFTLSKLALVAAVVRKILKTRVALGNISRVLLNQTRKFTGFKSLQL